MKVGEGAVFGLGPHPLTTNSLSDWLLVRSAERCRDRLWAARRERLWPEGRPFWVRRLNLSQPHQVKPVKRPQKLC